MAHSTPPRAPTNSRGESTTLRRAGWCVLGTAAACLAVATITACGAGGGGWSEAALAKAKSGVSVVVINSQPAVGPNRLGFGLIADDGSLLQAATGTVRLYRLNGEDAIAAGEHPLTAVSLREAPDHPHAAGTPAGHLHDPLATMYVANVDLAQGDWWGAEIAVRAGDKQYPPLRVRFFVAARSTVPALGAPAPRTTQHVLRDVQSIADIDSSVPPRPELHSVTVAEAIASGKPALVAFATPAFCQTRFCGPVVESVVAPLAKEYAGRASFIHIEPYNLVEARKGRLVPIKELEQWGLASEPYLFVLDREGRVAAQFEGISEHDEVARALDRVLAAPVPAATATPAAGAR